MSAFAATILALLLVQETPEPEAAGSRLVFDAKLSWQPDGTAQLQADSAPLDGVLDFLAEDAGFEWRNSGADLSSTVEGQAEGLPLDLIRWLLRDYNFVVVTNPTDSRIVERVIVISGPASEPAAALVSAGAEDALATLLRETPESATDFRSWLLAEVARYGGEPVAPPLVDLSDTPETLSDRMARGLEPLDGDYETYRLDPHGDGYGPRHLRGANDAAGSDIGSALARTTRSAVNGVRDLTTSLETACPDGGCNARAGD